MSERLSNELSRPPVQRWQGHSQRKASNIANATASMLSVFMGTGFQGAMRTRSRIKLAIVGSTTVSRHSEQYL